MKAHRVSLILAGKEVPDTLLVCHRCDNPACVNPNHLFLGTPKDNTQDMIRKGRKASLKGTKVAPEKTVKGENHGRSKLTASEVLRIREMCATGVSQSKVAKLMGVSQTCISKIHRRTKWRHV
jgi:DNA-binding transcriptional regulator YiaG